MTAVLKHRVPAPPGGYPVLPRLVRVTTRDFTELHWGRRPLLSRATQLPQPFTDLLDRAAVDELISQRGLRTPFLRVAKNGDTLADRQFTQGGGVGATVGDQVSDDKLLRLFSEGATIVLQGLHRSWAPLTGFSQRLSDELGHPVQANAYLTPPQSTGFSEHYDVHDVFVIQVHGRKRWRIHEPVRRHPLRSEPWTDRRHEVEQARGREPVLDVTLEPGDCLYLPRGYLHAATALGEVTLHVTLGVHPWTRRHLADELAAVALGQASESEALRRSLPLGLDLDDVRGLGSDVEIVRQALLEAIATVTPHELARRLGDRHRAAQRAAPVGLLAQTEAADDLAAGHVLVLRDFLMPRLERIDGRGARLTSRAGELSLSPTEVAAVARLLERRGAEVGELGLDLARRLLIGGVVVLG